MGYLVTLDSSGEVGWLSIDMNVDNVCIQFNRYFI
jgi:hypothetical protein